MTQARQFEDLLRHLAPQVLGAVARLSGRFDASEDAVQEALLAAARQWARYGVPEHPRGWLIRVASRRLADQLRGESARRRREAAAVALAAGHDLVAPAPDEASVPARDDTLTLLFLCCHPALPEVSQVALTLRAVGGLTTAQVARAFLVPEATMAKRISRAKARVRAAGARFEEPSSAQVRDRLPAVLHVLYLIFNEGYTSLAGRRGGEGDLAGEAIRLTRAVHRQLPDDGEVAGLLALMLLLDARHPARTRADGSLVPLAEQDRSRWLRQPIQEGVALVTHTLARAPQGPGPYQLQAAIAAVHAEAAGAQETDWRQILVLYELLRHVWSNPMVTLNHAVAVAMVRGPQAGLAWLAALDGDARLAGHHRLDAVRAHLLELAGDRRAAHTHYVLAARRTTSIPERRYLEAQAARVGAAS